jgi:uncharacterized membrane protein
MRRIGVIHWLFCFALFSGVVLGLAGGQAMASPQSDNSTLPQASGQKGPPPAETIELTSPYPVLRERAGNLFEFQVDLNYQGSKARVFNLSVVADPGAYVDILASFTASDKGIESILLKPNQEFPETVKVRYNPVLSKHIEPGNYLIKFRASSGNISDSIDLTAVVTARYEMFINTPSGRLNAEVTAGKANHIAVRVGNNGSVPLEDVRFSANVPQGWGISFNPEVVDSIDPGLAQESDMVITPHNNTIAGDYEITVNAITSETVAEMKLRITVITPAIWGWIAVLIVVVVIAGLAVIFTQLGRR